MEKERQIKFERHTSLSLGVCWAGEWPKYVLVHHGCSADDVRYVPERTCGYPLVTDEEEMAERDRAAREGRVLAPQDVPLCRKCTACGVQFRPMSKRPVWLNYCPNCGARLVDWGA